VHYHVKGIAHADASRSAPIDESRSRVAENLTAPYPTQDRPAVSKTYGGKIELTTVSRIANPHPVPKLTLRLVEEQAHPRYGPTRLVPVQTDNVPLGTRTTGNNACPTISLASNFVRQITRDRETGRHGPQSKMLSNHRPDCYSGGIDPDLSYTFPSL